MKINGLFRIGLFCVLYGVTAPLHAAWYQVEVLVFQYLNPDADGELWYGDPGLPERGNAIELLTGPDSAAVPAAGQGDSSSPAGEPPRVAYQTVSQANYRLEGVYQELKSTRAYRPLLHVAWQQPGQGSEASRSVHLEQPRNPGAADLSARNAAGDAGAGAEAGSSDAIVEGTFRLRSGRFLHVDVDLAYFPELFQERSDAAGAAPDPRSRLSADQPPDHVRMRTTRKVKLNELHYLDHPLFGVILQVSRL